LRGLGSLIANGEGPTSLSTTLVITAGVVAVGGRGDPPKLKAIISNGEGRPRTASGE